MKKVTKGNVTIKLWDLGGQPRFRSMWERYCRAVSAIVYVTYTYVLYTRLLLIYAFLIYFVVSLLLYRTFSLWCAMLVSFVYRENFLFFSRFLLKLSLIT